MKKILLIILIGLLTISCKSQSGRVENDLYGCLMDSLTDTEKEKTGIILSDFEQHLIDKGILESSKPESYWNLYNKMATTEVYDFSNDFNLSEKLSFLDRQNPSENQGFLDCQNKIFQSEKYLKSKLYKFTEELQSLKNHRITPVIIAKTTIKYLTVEDFELDYNRFGTLMFIENLN
ncbi:hypothetical protein [uncultured Aquimarina sp.]|uniref:hypothetical protein n=1 Tax=uncultured Aquimarina sp. TaxID=575652 RepID=UPI002627D0AE|nr:hypothetical protein [uncultured Aquimarina sp.]